MILNMRQDKKCCYRDTNIKRRGEDRVTLPHIQGPTRFDDSVTFVPFISISV